MKTIAAIATGNCEAGIGVIRISGDKAIEVAQKVFTSADKIPLNILDGYTAKYGHMYSSGERYDNAIALVFKKPNSYTGEDVVELSVHGGIYIVEKTLQAVLNAGADLAQPGEFTKRAFLNGKMDLTQAESVASLISSQGEESARAAYSLLQGSLSKRISKVVDTLAYCNAQMLVWVDYPDEDIPELEPNVLCEKLTQAKDELTALLSSYDNGQIITQGVDTAIVGKVNAGKSTLMNMLSGKEKSIVTHIAGTTRDVVEGEIRLGSIVLHLSDTAGIRTSDDIVENIGIKKSLEKIENARLVLAVFDGSTPLDENDFTLIEHCKGKSAIALINKNDLPVKTDVRVIKNNFEKVLMISAKNSTYSPELEQAIKEVLGIEGFDSTQPIIVNQRQKLSVANALQSVIQALDGVMAGVTNDAVSVMIDSALDELLALTGKRATSEVVDNIFSRFCVGK